MHLVEMVLKENQHIEKMSAKLIEIVSVQFQKLRNFDSVRHFRCLFNVLLVESLLFCNVAEVN